MGAMGMLAVFLISISLSLDSLGVGFTYGMRKINMSFWAKLVISIISAVITLLSLVMGDSLQKFLPECITKMLGIFILLSIGAFVICHSFIKKNHENLNDVCQTSKKDLDCPQKTGLVEAFYIGLALSLDSMGSGIALSMVGINNFYLPVAVAVCQYIFLSAGIFLGQKFSVNRHICSQKVNLISGVILIIIGLTRLF